MAAGETTQNIVDIPTVQKQVIVQGNPEVQVVEQIQERIVETIKVNPLERVHQRAVEQSVSFFERLDEIGKRLEMSLARQSENEEMIKEIGSLLEEKRAIDRADLIAGKKYGGSRTLQNLARRRSSIRRSSIIFNMNLVPMESTDSSYHGRVA